MRQKNLLIAIAIVSVMLCLSIGGTLAFWVVESRAVNQIETATLKGKLLTETEPYDSLYPGDVVPHLVNVKNEGTTDMLVRLKVDKAWASGLEANNINISFNSTQWVDGGDGYYYYKGILSPGATTVEPLFKEFELDKSTESAYQNDEIKIDVTMNCIQAANNAISAKWNKTYQDIGVSAPSQQPQGQATKVTFVSPDDKFTFDSSDPNLFAGFDKLVPGDKRSQVINVKNSYNESIEVFIRAEQVNQNATGQQLQRVEELLQKHAKITIRNKSGQTLYDGAIWGNYTTEPSGNNSMKKNISMGKIAANDSADVTVDLELAPEIENEYQGLLANIRWVFTAEGGQVDVTTTPGPGDISTPRPTGSLTPAPTGSSTLTPSTPNPTGTWSTPAPTGGGTWQPSKTPGTGTTPKTGVESKLPWMFMGIVALTCVLLGLIIAYKKQKARDDYSR